MVDAVQRLTMLLTGVTSCAMLVWQSEHGLYAVPADPSARGERASHGLVLLPETVPLAEHVRRAATAAHGAAASLPGLWGEVLPGDTPVTCLPLVTKGQVIGVLAASLEASESLPAAQQTLLEGIARQAALGLDNALLLTSQQEEAWVSTALLQVANVISTTGYDLAEAMNAIARLIPMLVGVSWCAVLLWDPETRQYRRASSYGLKAQGQHELKREDLSPDRAPWLRDLLRRGPVALQASQLREMGIEPALESPDEGIVLPLQAHRFELGLLVVGTGGQELMASRRRMAVLSGIARETALAISASRLYQQAIHQHSLENELRLAREIQMSFLPEHSPAYPGWDMAVEWRSARGVSGDYYDFVPLGDAQLAISVADVSGKGIAAALYMAMSRSVLRAAALDAEGPAETLKRANRVLMQESRSGMFVSIAYAILDLESGVVRYARAGHPPPLHVHTDGTIAVLEPVGIALGIMEDPEIDEETITLLPGEMLVMYTDGITEAWNGSDDEFGLERLQAVLAEHAGQSASDVVSRITEAVGTFVDPGAQSDDYTILVVKREES